MELVLACPRLVVKVGKQAGARVGMGEEGLGGKGGGVPLHSELFVVSFRLYFFDFLSFFSFSFCFVSFHLPFIQPNASNPPFPRFVPTKHHSSLPNTVSFPQVWEEWRDQERLHGGGNRAVHSSSTHPSHSVRGQSGRYPSARPAAAANFNATSADVVLCSLERLTDVSGEAVPAGGGKGMGEREGKGGASADVLLARSVRWSQVRQIAGLGWW